jgi:hypothetical protein
MRIQEQRLHTTRVLISYLTQYNSFPLCILWATKKSALNTAGSTSQLLAVARLPVLVDAASEAWRGGGDAAREALLHETAEAGENMGLEGVMGGVMTFLMMSLVLMAAAAKGREEGVVAPLGCSNAGRCKVHLRRL